MNRTFEDDAIDVATALITECMQYYDGDYGPSNTCRYCNGLSTGREEDFKHELGCPALIAQDLLTVHNMKTTTKGLI